MPSLGEMIWIFAISIRLIELISDRQTNFHVPLLPTCRQSCCLVDTQSHEPPSKFVPHGLMGLRQLVVSWIEEGKRSFCVCL